MRRLMLLTLLAAGLALPAQAQNWSVFKSDRFGFAMLVAPGTQWAARDYGQGWGGIRARTGVLEFAAIVKLGTFASPQELGASAVLLTGIPARAWTKTDEGRGKAGWKWWQTYKVTNDAAGRVLFTVLGTGQRGSYVLFLGTTQADFAAHNALYDQWYRSLTLY